MIPTLLAVACVLAGLLAGIGIGAALVLPAAHRRVVQRAWNGHDRRR